MNIIERIITEKKYLKSLDQKKVLLTNEKDSLIKEEKYLEKEANQTYKEKFEIESEIKHFQDVNKIITFHTCFKLLIALIITILVIKYLPVIYAHLFQNIILLPFYFYLAYTWVKDTDKEFTFKNTFNITQKKLTIDNLNFKMKKFKMKKITLKDKLNNINKNLEKIVDEENIHKTYLHTLEEILNKYYYESLENYLGKNFLEEINYPKSPTLKLEKEIN